MTDDHYSPHGKTVLELFQDGLWFNKERGCAARDWYVLLRHAIPMPCSYGEVNSPCTHLILCIDIASGAYLLYEPLRWREMTAPILADVMTRAMNMHGCPRKGVIVTPMVWGPYAALKRSAAGKDIDFPSYDVVGADFGEMPLADKIRFEDWILANELVCSFTADAAAGGQPVTARESEALLLPALPEEAVAGNGRSP